MPARGALASGLLVVGIATPDGAVVDGVRAPAFAPDGRLAVSVTGDLWVLEPDGSGGFTGARPITQDGAWDRDPAWTPDGGAIVFSSDRGGTGDLWRVAVAAGQAASGSDGAGAQAPERLTQTGDEDIEPSVGPDGTIVFVRGRGGDSDLWTRSPDGAERRLTTETGAEREPAWSPDGQRIAFVAVRTGRRELRLREQDGRETTLVSDRPARGPTWSPDGARLAFGTVEGTAAGIWTIGIDGRLLQAAGSTGGVPAWSPDGAWIVFAQPDAGDGGYN